MNIKHFLFIELKLVEQPGWEACGRTSAFPIDTTMATREKKKKKLSRVTRLEQRVSFHF